MADPGTYISELDAKNRAQIERLVGGLLDLLEKEGVSIPDLLLLDLKLILEAMDISALWLADCDDIGVKLWLARTCGDGARHFDVVMTRLEALGVPTATLDPRQGGYSKLFAFLRSLQTVEERASAGGFTLRALAMERAAALGARALTQGDAETARLYQETLHDDDRRHYEEARRVLLRVALNEESQARARRAAYRVLELCGEMFEPTALRRSLRQVKKV